MIMDAVVAIALGLTPAQPGTAVRMFHFSERDYAGLLGRYQEDVDARGITHLRGFDPRNGEPFELAVNARGRVEGTVGDTYVIFFVREAA